MQRRQFLKLAGVAAVSPWLPQAKALERERVPRLSATITTERRSRIHLDTIYGVKRTRFNGAQMMCCMIG